MSKQQKQESQLVGYLLDAALVAGVVVGLALLLFFAKLSTAATLAGLVGIWMVDAFLKRTYHHSNDTLFADLSFSSFVFVGGQSMGLVTNTSRHIDTDTSIRIGITLLALLFLWVGNLHICKGLGDKIQGSAKISKLKFGLWATSFTFALISTASVLVLQIIGYI